VRAALVACLLVASCSSDDAGDAESSASSAASTTASAATTSATTTESAATTPATATESTDDGTTGSADTITTGSADAVTTTTVPAAPTTTIAPREPVTVTGPIAGDARLASRSLDLATLGYVQEEYFIEGDATSYEPDGELGADGKWVAKPAMTAPFKTRVVVRRPAASAGFSGTVLVEWLNVSAGADGDPDWGYAADEIIRSGDAWVGVSVQAVGVTGGGAITGDTTAGGGLVNDDPVRYGSLVHPGDAFAFDIFTQAATSLTDHDGPSPLGDLTPDHLIAVGESQSAFFLTTYINAVQPIVGLFDGFLVHSREGGAAMLDGSVAQATSRADAVAIRDDGDVPVLVFLTETDLTVLGNGYLDQPDSSSIKVWETAGTAHADAYLLEKVYNLGADSDLAAIVNCPAPLNAGPQHELLQAAVHHLVAWVAEDTEPPTAPRLELADNDPPTIARDERGIALGGIRSPLVDVPVAVLSGDMVEGATGFCSLFGSTTPFDAAALAELYPTADLYVQAFTESANEAVKAGFLLEPDAAELITAAVAQATTLGG
jgi:hypothetical protein